MGCGYSSPDQLHPGSADTAKDGTRTTVHVTAGTEENRKQDNLSSIPEEKAASQNSGSATHTPKSTANDYNRALTLAKRASFAARKSVEEFTIDAVKERLHKEWSPEYKPEEIRPPRDSPYTISERSTNVNLSMIVEDKTHYRKTKVICTMGPKCWGEDMLGSLIDAGLNVMRMNFSHGTHEAHLEVLNRFRKVCEVKGSYAATLLDTKGPEVRTAMLRDHKPITLEAGQDIIVESVGDKYTTFEGYKTESETRIGLSYGLLCQSVKPGNKILLADGTITIEVVEVLSDKEIKGCVLNTKQLGERKNCNLPGVKVDIPVLTDKDIDDLQNFGCKNKVDFVAASFVQSAEDVKFIRRTLDSAGGQDIKIISKIENEEGLRNFDAILEFTDGVMVARGDLGMEIPSEKVPIAQKMIITKCNIVGKFVICATQMLESMISNPLPTRAEMTDVANAVYDGVDGVMLSGETANGEFPDTAVATMAAIVANAEQAVDYYSQYSFVRYWTTKGNEKPMSAFEATLSAASKMAVLFTEDSIPDTEQDVKTPGTLVVCITKTGRAAHLITKYRPPCPVVVVTNNDSVLRQCSTFFGQLAMKHDNLKGELATLVLKSINFVESEGIEMRYCKVIIVHGAEDGSADKAPVIKVLRTDVGLRTRFSSSVNNICNLSGVPSLRQGVKTFRSIRTNLELITKPLDRPRSTRIVCTMGPKCWGEEELNQLLEAGMDIIRLNFSHGTHKQHAEVLERFRKVCRMKADDFRKKGISSPPLWGCLLDTKGPEIRTAMLKGHQPIQLDGGQDIIIEAVGDKYTTFEGHKNDKETRIGLSYAKLCSSVSEGNAILLADGSITIKVMHIINERELVGKVMNTKMLGERKNCNLPGVKVQLPVLTKKDIDDLKNFACKHKMDYVAASFVQSAEDVKFIRDVLNEAGGEAVKIISKIENSEGLHNFDDILKETDGVMVARGDLGMEIPAEKVPLAQKMLITKCNLAGKFVITATQMLESMIGNPRPTRAEMTDVANAIVDGTDAVMLSGETANGSFPRDAVATMAAICQNAEQMVNGHQRFNFLRNHTPKPMTDAEAVASAAVMTAMDIKARAIFCLTSSGRGAKLVSKYRPKTPIFVLSENEEVVRQCRSHFGQYGILLKHDTMDFRDVVKLVVSDAKTQGIIDLRPTDQIVLVGRRKTRTLEDQRLSMRTVVVGDPTGVIDVGNSAYAGKKTLFYRSTKIGLDTICDEEKYKYIVRKTKIVCTMGPKCWSEEMLGKLLDAGMNVMRLNFSHGKHEDHFQVLDRFRKVCESKGSTAACLLDTKGPEVRTAMLKDHKPIDLVAGQEIVIEAVGDKYTEFEGYKEENETRIGLSYAKLCESVTPGNKILLADGTLSIEVVEVLNDRELKGRVLNSKALGERKNCNLPGVKVDIPVLTEKDINDLQNFACKHKMDFVAASFVQTKEDVLFIRRVLDEAGGPNIKIISKIENAEGLKNFDEILEVTDGVMVARGDLGMEIPVEKVPLAQKMMITKSNIAGKFVICATQMLESMITNPVPTRAEMTDVANAVFDGVDAVMLSGETANGSYPDVAVSTMAQTCKSAELGVNYYQVFDYIREFTPKPVGTVEAVASTMSKNAVDVRPGMMVIFSEGGKTARLVSKYRPCCPVLVVTSNKSLARHCSAYFATNVMLLDERVDGGMERYVERALEYGVSKGLCVAGKEVLVLTSTLVQKTIDGQTQQLPQREVYCTIMPGTLDYKRLGHLAPFVEDRDPKFVAKTLLLRSTIIDLNMLTEDSTTVRKTKIMATLGPSCASENVLGAMLDAGLDVARIEVPCNKIDQSRDLMEKFRRVCKEKKISAAILLDVTGPRFHTTKLIPNGASSSNNDTAVNQGDKVQIRCGDKSSENDCQPEAGQAAILRLRSEDVDSLLKEGDRLEDQDSQVQFEIVSAKGDQRFEAEIVSPGKIGLGSAVCAVAFNPNQEKIISGIEQLIKDFQVEFVAASMSSGDDVMDLKRLLAAVGHSDVKVMSKVDCLESLKEVDGIIEATDGIMVARKALGRSITPQKVALAQNVLIAKTNVAGKVVITAGQTLESMVSNPRPTRAEMTDVANAVFDGTDCLLLDRETSHGDFPVDSVSTAHAIVQNAEQATNYFAVHSFVRDMSPKPFNTLEAAASSIAKACVDANVGLCVVISERAAAADLVAKYRPPTPQVVVTKNSLVAAQCQVNFGQFAFRVEEYGESIQALLRRAIEWAKGKGLLGAGKSVGLMHGSAEANADEDPVIRVVDLQDL